ASEQKEVTSESETEDAEDESGQDDEAGREQETEDQTEAKPKKKGGFQRRIDKLNAAKAAAQQEADYWKRLALEKGAGEPKKDQVDSKAPATAQSNEGKPNPDNFDTHAEYVEALTDWKTEQNFKKRAQQSE